MRPEESGPSKRNLRFRISTKEVKRIPTSSVVLSSQRVNLKDALFNAVKDKEKAEAANPLVENGEKLIPSVTRVFRKGGAMYVYLQAYQQDGDTHRPIVAYVSLYRGQTKAFETPPVKIGEGWPNRLKTTPVDFNIALNSLAPGRYDCQVTVLDPTAKKAAFWQAPVVIVP